MTIKFFNKVYGCQANVADSEGLSKFLLGLGCSQANIESDADLIIINTCAVREKAEQKLFSFIGRLADLKKAKPYLKIGIIGCVASYKKQELYTSFDCINFVHGAREEIGMLQEYLKEIVLHLQQVKQKHQANPIAKIRSIKQVRDIKNFLSKIKNQAPILNKESISNLNLKIHACGTQQISDSDLLLRSHINIMTGCNKYCAYCIVPFTRGREISYPFAEILQAVKKDLDRGVKEINLLGQNVNSYIDPETRAKFPELLKQVADLAGDFWVRFVSAHPQDMTQDLFDVMSQHRDKLTAYLHFPLQSGSNKILKAMNRNYSAEEFLQKIEWARMALQGLTITTDIIVGFPGETEEDYLETRKLMEVIKFDQIYSFVYSKRQYTKAFSMSDDCPESVKLKRLMDLQARQREISLERNQAWIGKTLKILVEKQLENGKLLARTEGNTRILVDSHTSLTGKFTNACVENASVVNLFGKLVD
ncbi:MAG: (Dimethylallyl)adenosine tRNA methylthiotransferase MiaB [candidate division TM6 bacterium GW2011_GWF2_37_49]|nr:MAG: (Dimethylallyl)adenosine tRNA methylthiotransferase MiaB [candidate division TM6 bacterium GW2011_GWF2_37_49]